MCAIVAARAKPSQRCGHDIRSSPVLLLCLIAGAAPAAAPAFGGFGGGAAPEAAAAKAAVHAWGQPAAGTLGAPPALGGAAAAPLSFGAKPAGGAAAAAAPPPFSFGAEAAPAFGGNVLAMQPSIYLNHSVANVQVASPWSRQAIRRTHPFTRKVGWGGTTLRPISWLVYS